MVLTCARAVEIYNFLKNSTGNEFLQEWPSILTELLDGIRKKDSPTAGSSVENIDEPAAFLARPSKAACLVLIEFLKVSSQFPNVGKELSTKYLHILYQRLTSKQVIYDDCLLLTLKSCLQYYPSSCGHFFGKSLLRHLQQFTDLSSSILRRNAADCYSLLPFLGPAGEKHAKHAENWQDQVEFLLATIHDCLKLLLGSNAEALKNCTFQLNSVKFTQFHEKLTSLDVEKLTNRIDFCSKSLKFMFSTNFPQPLYVKIPISPILDLLQCFINAINLHKSLRCNVVQILIDEFSEVVRIFSALPEILGVLLAPYCSKIFDLFESALFSVNSIQSSFKIFELKSSIYQCLSEIGQFLGVSSRINVVLPKFWSYIKRDLEISKLSEDLGQKSDFRHVGFSEKSKPGKKKKAKIANDTQQQTDFGDQFIQKRQDMSPKRDIVLNIAKSLSGVIAQCGSAFKAALYRDLQQIICKLLLSVRINLSSNGSNDIPSPYDDIKCRLALLEILRSLVLCRHPECAPAVQCAVQIFTVYCTNERKEIVEFCHQALSAVSCATKPRVPSLESCVGVNETLRKAGDFEQQGDEVEDETENFQIDNNFTKNFENFSNAQEKRETSIFAQMNENDQILSADRSISEFLCEEIKCTEQNSIDTEDMDTIIVNIDDESSNEEECEEICILPPSKRAKMAVDAEEPQNHTTPIEQPKNHVTSPDKPKTHVISPEKTKEKIVPAANTTNKTIEVIRIEDLLEDFVDAPAD